MMKRKRPQKTGTRPAGAQQTAARPPADLERGVTVVEATGVDISTFLDQRVNARLLVVGGRHMEGGTRPVLLKISTRLEKREHASAKRAKTALSARELKDRVRKLFTQQNFWSRRDIVAEVGNANTVGAALEELCVRVTQKGLHYGEYTLKQEFKVGLVPAKPEGASSAP